jgi:hypothetical protein
MHVFNMNYPMLLQFPFVCVYCAFEHVEIVTVKNGIEYARMLED